MSKASKPCAWSAPRGFRRAMGLVLAAEALMRGGGMSAARADVIVSGARTSSINLDMPPPEFLVPPTGTTALVSSGASIMVSNGDALFAQNTSWAVTNGGALRSLNGRGLNLNNGRSLVNRSMGMISGTSAGVNFQNSAGTVTNHGSITASTGQGIRLEQGGMVDNSADGTISGITGGVHFQNGTASLTNAGIISASAGQGVRLEQGGPVINSATGMISGTTAGIHYQNGTATLTNAGSITASAGEGVHLEQGGAVQNNGGVIQGTTRALHFQNGTASLVNSGLIEATAGVAINVVPRGTVQNTGGTIRGLTEGIHFQNGAVSLINSGTIEATAGRGVFIETGQATIQNSLGGIIRGSGGASGEGLLLNNGGAVNNDGRILTGDGGIALDFRNIGTLFNSGEVGGGATGVHIRNSPANITNNAGGVIRGTDFGVNVDGGAGNVINAGQIVGEGAPGIGIQFLNNGTITNSGDIGGETIGVTIRNGGTITTTGRIAGGTSSVVFQTGNGALTLDTGATLVGTAEGGGSSAVTLLGSGMTSNDFAAFGRLSMEGASWTLAGRRGEFTEAFVRSGELLLIGNINSSQATIAPTGSATAIVAGLTSSWTNTGTFTVGQQGAGTLTVAEGGRVSASAIVIAEQAGSTGNVNIGAPAGQAPAAPGLIGGTPVQFGAGMGTLTFNHTAVHFFGEVSRNYTFESQMSGNGVVNVLAGTTVLAGDSTAFTGTANVTGGRLFVSGVLGGTSVSVTTGGTLGGSGSLLGDVTVGDGGILAPGIGIGTLTMGGDLSLSAGSILAFELGQADVVGGELNDLIMVGGNLTLDGVLDISDAGGFGPGTYRLINYTGALTDQGLDLRNLPPGFSAADFQVQTSVAQQVNLVTAVGQVLDFWDGPAAPGDGAVNGGDGIWNAANSNWTNMAGALNGAWSNEFGVFGGQAGVVTVEGAVGLTGLQFSTDGYQVVAGPGGVLMTDEPESVIRVDQGVTAEIAAPIQGSGGLAKRDFGTLILSGVNTFTGGLTVSGGIVSVSSDANLGALSGGLTLDRGILQTTQNFITDRAITLSARGGGFLTDPSTTLTITSGVSGDGDLVKAGLGTLHLAGANSYAGDTIVTAGTLIGDAGSIRGNLFNAGVTAFDQAADGVFAGDVRGNFIGDGTMIKRGAGALTLGGLSTLNWTIEQGELVSSAERFVGDVAIGAGTMRFDQGMDAQYEGLITGAGRLVKSGAGMLTFTGDQAYAGGTVITGGVLKLGTGGTRGSIVGDVINDGALVIHRSNDYTVDGVISGSGSVQHVGIGTTTFTGANTYTGGTLITQGTVRVGDGATSGSIVGDVQNESELLFRRSDRVVFPGVIAGSGVLTQEGPGILVLSGTNTYTGGTTIRSGTLQIGDGGTTGSILGDVVNNGTLSFSRSDTATYAGVISGPGFLTVNGPGTLVLAGRNTYTGLTTVEAGVLQIGDGSANGSITGDIDNRGMVVVNRSGVSTYRGTVTGPGEVVLIGSGVLVVESDQAFTGRTTIAAGTLQIGNAGTTGSVPGNITNNSALVFNRADALVYSGIISGAGSVTQAGSGTLILTSDQAYTGGTTIAEGTLQIGDGGTTGSILGNVADGTSLAFNRSDAFTFAGVVSGAGSVVQNGAGVLTLSADNTYEGGTVLNAGTVDVMRDSNLGAPSGPLSFGGGTLRLGSSFDLSPDRLITLNAPGGVIDTQSNSTTIAQAITGEGGLTKRGTGTMRLTGASTYTGPTSVEAGVLDINGSIASALTMAQGTRLMGTGIVGPTANSGTIAPGNSIGTLTVNGDLAHRAGTYEVEVEPLGTSDLIRVSGAVSLEGGMLTPLPLPGMYEAPLRYLIVDSTDGVTGQFATPGLRRAFFDARIEYQPDQVFLVLDPLPFNNPLVGISYNLDSVTAAAEAVFPTATGELQELAAQIVTLDVDQAIASFNSLTGDMHPTLASLMLQGHALLGQSVTRRLASRFSGGEATAQPESSMALFAPEESPEGRLSEMMEAPLQDDLSPALDNGFWARIYGVLAGDLEADGNGPGASYNTGGAAVGYDRRVGDDLVLGVSVDYSFTRVDFDRDSGRADVNAYDAAIYAGYSHQDTYVDVVLAYAYLDNDTQRGVTGGDIFHTAEADYGGHRFAGYVEAGHRFTLEGDVRITPLASVQYTWLRQLEFTESGAGDIGLTSDAFETQSFRTGLGVRVSRPFELPDGRLVPELRARWFHECLDQFASYDPAFIGAPGSTFNVRGTSADRDSLALGFGVELVRQGSFAMFLDYDARFNSEEVAHNLGLGLRFEW